MTNKSLVAIIMVVGLALGSAVPGTAAAEPGAAPGRLWTEVNPFIGTSGGVNTFPGPDVPFGMIQWGPDTPSRPDGGGYEYNDSQISGFSLTHLSGPGCPVGDDVPILPVAGTLPADPSATTTPFSHANETAQAGDYAVSTGSGHTAVRTELSTTARAGIGRFTFPRSTQSHLVFKLNGGAHAPQTVDGTSAMVVDDHEIAGTVSSGKHFCAHNFTKNDYTVHFDITFDALFTSTMYGTSANGGPAGVELTFDTTSNPTVIGKVGISYTSGANAVLNRTVELPGWNLDAVRHAAQADWNAVLGRIQVGGGTATQRTEFYTALYHASLFPSRNSDDNGEYLGMDQKVHRVAPGHDEYANYSGWDIYRSQVQLASIVAPRQTSDAITSILNDYDQSGQLPRWGFPNGETYVTAGDPADPIIADAYAFGARGFDAGHALDAMVTQATEPDNNVRQGESVRDQYGYLPYDITYGGCCNLNQNYLVSTDLEFDTADHSIAALAAALGDTSTYRTFATRAQDWQNDFNPSTGYVQSRLTNGQWLAGFTPSTTTGFEEGTSAQYTPMVPFNLKALIAAKGGSSAYVSFLDSLLQNLSNPGPTNANLNDEPSIEIPWEYDYAGAPWQTQAIVRQAQQQLYFDAPVGQFGNDDLGAMSSWFVWSNLGFYPEDPGTDVLVLGSPVFPSAAIQLANGRTITITAPQAAPDAPYVHGVTLDGVAHDAPWLTFAQLANGGTVDYALATTPDTAWGSSPSAAPPSDGYGEQATFRR
jgi:predicted alpha-1,2-mannosidase